MTDNVVKPKFKNHELYMHVSNNYIRLMGLTPKEREGAVLATLGEIGPADLLADFTDAELLGMNKFLQLVHQEADHERGRLLGKQQGAEE